MYRAVTILFCITILLSAGCVSSLEETADDPGLYDLDDGRVRAVGTLQRVNLEGGFLAVVEPATSDSESESSDPVIIAVLINAEEFTNEIARMESSQIVATGTLFEGVSVRMAGPEIIVESIEELDVSGTQ